MYPILEELSADSSYHRCDDILKEEITGYEYTYQKVVRDDSGTKYALNFHFYSVNPFHKNDTNMLVEVEAQFNTGRITFNVHCLNSPERLEVYEQMFDSIWLHLDCDYYENSQNS